MKVEVRVKSEWDMWARLRVSGRSMVMVSLRYSSGKYIVSTLPHRHRVVNIVNYCVESFANVIAHIPARWEDGCTCLSPRYVSSVYTLWQSAMGLQIPV
jgi:hypothetical protein